MECEDTSRQVMLCRKVFDDEGNARIVLEPVDSAEALTTKSPPLPYSNLNRSTRAGQTVSDSEGENVQETSATLTCLARGLLSNNELNSDSTESFKPPKPYISCEICGKKFFVTDTTYKRTPKERLTLHIVTEHDRERLYQCPYSGCFKAYNNVKLLNQHKLVHTTCKQHQCSQCKKEFHRKTHLLAHMRRHNANPHFKPRASRRQCNPYIQAQRKKDASQNCATDPSVQKVEEQTVSQQLNQMPPAADDTIPGPLDVVIVTEEELEEMRKIEAEIADRPVTDYYVDAKSTQEVDDAEMPARSEVVIYNYGAFGEDA